MHNYTDKELFDSENRRIEFLINRDSKSQVVEFCKQGIKNYRTVLRKTPGILTRRALVVSCIVYRSILISYGKYYRN